jgi:hypothetical protein
MHSNAAESPPKTRHLLGWGRIGFVVGTRFGHVSIKFLSASSPTGVKAFSPLCALRSPFFGDFERYRDFAPTDANAASFGVYTIVLKTDRLLIMSRVKLLAIVCIFGVIGGAIFVVVSVLSTREQARKVLDELKQLSVSSTPNDTFDKFQWKFGRSKFKHSNQCSFHTCT